MTTDNLTQRLESLDQGADFADPGTYAALLYPDEASQVDEPKADTTTAPAPQAQAPAPAPVDSSTPAAAAETKDRPVDGVLTKDGKHVLPFEVLASTRARARDLAEANDRLQQELQALKDGKSTPESQAAATAAVEDLELTDEELRDLEDIIPAVGKMAKGFKAMQQTLQELQSAPPPATAPAPQVDAQALIDQRPLLARWQAKGGAIWNEAVSLDQQLQVDPEWALKSDGERFTEVQRRIAEDFGIPIPGAPNVSAQSPSAATPTPPAPPPVQTSTVTPTLSDFNGSPVAVGDPMANMAVGQQVDKAAGMSVEELRRMVGISY